jgi:phospholipid N-methyltransferase
MYILQELITSVRTCAVQKINLATTENMSDISFKNDTRDATSRIRKTGAVATLQTSAHGKRQVLGLGASAAALSQESHLAKTSNLSIVEPDRNRAIIVKGNLTAARVVCATFWDILDEFRPKDASLVVSGIPFTSLSKQAHHMILLSIQDYLTEAISPTFLHYGSAIKPPFEAPLDYSWERASKAYVLLPFFALWQLRFLGKVPSGLGALPLS